MNLRPHAPTTSGHDAPRNLATPPPRLRPGPRVTRLPSGLTLEHATRRPLWPLVLTCLIIWSAVFGVSWWLTTSSLP